LVGAKKNEEKAQAENGDRTPENGDRTPETGERKRVTRLQGCRVRRQRAQSVEYGAQGAEAD